MPSQIDNLRGQFIVVTNKFAFVNILPNNEKSLRLIFNESE